MAATTIMSLSELLELAKEEGHTFAVSIFANTQGEYQRYLYKVVPNGNINYDPDKHGIVTTEIRLFEEEIDSIPRIRVLCYPMQETLDLGDAEADNVFDINPTK